MIPCRMGRLQRILVCVLTVFVTAGCSAPSDTDGGTDVAAPQDSIVADVARDAGDVQSVDAGHTDTGTMIDSGTTDAGMSTDTGTDAIVATDSGADAGVRDAGQSDVSVVDAGTPPDASVSDAGVPMCPGTMHVCLCATGYYCLQIGFACLSPSAPCP